MSTADICAGDLDKALTRDEEHVARKRSKSDVACYPEDKISIQVVEGLHSSISLAERRTSKVFYGYD